MRGWRARRSALALLVVLAATMFAATLLTAGVAVAEEAAEAAADSFTEGDLMRLLQAKPIALWGFILARFLPIVAGFGLLIAWFVRRVDRKRLGTPPPAFATVTRAFDLAPAAALLAGGFLIVPGLVLYLGAGGQAAGAPLWMQVLAMAIGAVPAALLVVMRRQRLQIESAETAGANALTTPPGLGRASLLGLQAVCIALLIATPLALLWALVIKTISGETPGLQPLVQQALDPASGYEPWLIAGYGVLVAPFAEEALFRGLLHPALKQALVQLTVDPRRARLVTAVVVSLLFALVHNNLLAFVPLFALAMVLTWLFERTNSLAACVAAHALHNAFSLVPLILLRVT